MEMLWRTGKREFAEWKSGRKKGREGWEWKKENKKLQGYVVYWLLWGWGGLRLFSFLLLILRRRAGRQTRTRSLHANPQHRTENNRLFGCDSSSGCCHAKAFCEDHMLVISCWKPALFSFYSFEQCAAFPRNGGLTKQQRCEPVKTLHTHTPTFPVSVRAAATVKNHNIIM